MFARKRERERARDRKKQKLRKQQSLLGSQVSGFLAMDTDQLFILELALSQTSPPITEAPMRVHLFDLFGLV